MPEPAVSAISDLLARWALCFLPRQPEVSLAISELRIWRDEMIEDIDILNSAERQGRACVFISWCCLNSCCAIENRARYGQREQHDPSKSSLRIEPPLYRLNEAGLVNKQGLAGTIQDQ